MGKYKENIKKLTHMIHWGKMFSKCGILQEILKNLPGRDKVQVSIIKREDWKKALQDSTSRNKTRIS